MNCCGPHRRAIAGHFDATVADADRRRYRLKGPDRRARRLVEALERIGAIGRTVLDIGSGIGIISLELLKRGAATATLADASPSYLHAARAAGNELGLADRLQFVEGDFVETAARISDADLVVMDRSVCCYPDWRPLLVEAARHARVALALTYPRDRVDVHLAIGLGNRVRKWRHDDFRAFVHPPDEMEAALEAAGLGRQARARAFPWNIDVYRRSAS